MSVDPNPLVTGALGFLGEECFRFLMDVETTFEPLA